MTDEVPHPYAPPPEPDPRERLSGEAYVLDVELEEARDDLRAAKEAEHESDSARVFGPVMALTLFLWTLGFAWYIEPYDSIWWDRGLRTLADHLLRLAFPAVASAGFAVWSRRSWRTLAERREHVARLEAHVDELETRRRELAPPDGD